MSKFRGAAVAAATTMLVAAPSAFAAPVAQVEQFTLGGGVQATIAQGAEAINSTNLTPSAAQFTGLTPGAAPIAAKTTFIVGDGQSPGAPDAARFSTANSTINRSPEFGGTDPCPAAQSAAASGCLWDTLSFDVSSTFTAATTSASATMVPGGTDCLLDVARVLTVGPASAQAGHVAAGTGLRGRTAASITLAGVPAGARVAKALLFWGHTAGGNPGGAMTFAGQSRPGTLIGTGGDVCWGPAATFSHRADVTSLVTGNGTYTLAGFPSASGSGPLADGASLVVFYDASPVAPTAAPSRIAVTWTEGDGAKIVDPGFNVDDADGGQLSATVELIGAKPGDKLNGSTTLPLTISSRSIADLRAALRAVTFEAGGGDAPQSGDRSLRVTVSDGALSTTAADIVISVVPVNDPPVVTFVAPTDVMTGDEVTFTASATDPEGDAITSWAWDFDGDGTTDATGQTVTTYYTTPGTRQVTVTATDNGTPPASGSATGSVVVGGPACGITGTSGPDRLSGGGGNDVICGLGGDDTITGSYGMDTLLGGGGNDSLRGGYDNDVLRGSTGNDTVDGEYGNDTVIGGLGQDILDGGYGDDLLDALDGTVDGLSNCGAGIDRLLADAGDPRKGCESASTTR